MSKRPWTGELAGPSRSAGSDPGRGGCQGGRRTWLDPYSYNRTMSEGGGVWTSVHEEISLYFCVLGERDKWAGGASEVEVLQEGEVKGESEVRARVGARMREGGSVTRRRQRRPQRC